MTEIHAGQFVTATVTPPDPKLDEHKLAELARELAWNMRPAADTLAMFSITQEQFDHWVQPNDFFKRVFEVFVIEWQGAGSTVKRLALKSAYGLELKMPEIIVRMGDKRENLTGVIEAAKLLAKIAGAGEQKPDPTAGEKFNITINIGEKKLTFVETVGGSEGQRQAIPPIIEGQALHKALQSIADRPRDPIEVQSVPEGESADEELFQVPEGD